MVPNYHAYSTNQSVELTPRYICLEWYIRGVVVEAVRQMENFERQQNVSDSFLAAKYQLLKTDCYLIFFWRKRSNYVLAIDTSLVETYLFLILRMTPYFAASLLPLHAFLVSMAISVWWCPPLHSQHWWDEVLSVVHRHVLL